MNHPKQAKTNATLKRNQDLIYSLKTALSQLNNHLNERMSEVKGLKWLSWDFDKPKRKSSTIKPTPIHKILKHRSGDEGSIRTVHRSEDEGPIRTVRRSEIPENDASEEWRPGNR